MRQACDIAAEYGITIGIQNHDDIAAHYLSMVDLMDEIDRSNCRACFDAWSIALHGDDLAEAVRRMGDRTHFDEDEDFLYSPILSVVGDTRLRITKRARDFDFKISLSIPKTHNLSLS